MGTSSGVILSRTPRETTPTVPSMRVPRSSSPSATPSYARLQPRRAPGARHAADSSRSKLPTRHLPADPTTQDTAPIAPSPSISSQEGSHG